MSQQDSTITVSEREWRSYRSLYDTLLQFKRSATEGCFGNQYGFLSEENIPQKDNLDLDIQWLSKGLPEIINTYVNYDDLRKIVYSTSSEKSVSKKISRLDKIERDVKRLEKKLEKRKDKDLPTRSQYNKCMRELLEKLKICRENNKLITTQNSESTNALDRNLRQIQAIENLIKGLKERGYIIDDESENENEKKTQLNSEETTDKSDLDSLLTIENEQDLANEIEKLRAKKKEKEKENKKKEKEWKEFEKEAFRNLSTGDTVAPPENEYQYDPFTGTWTHNTILKSLTRDKEMFDIGCNNVNTSYNRIFAYHNSAGQYFEENAATSPELVLFSKGNFSAYINTDKILPHDSEKELAEKKKYNYYGYSERLLDVMYVNGDTLLYSPLEHYFALSNIFGKRCAFLRRNMSENTAMAIFVGFLLLLTSKSTIAELVTMFSTRFSYSRQYIIEFIIGMSRIFMGLADYIRTFAAKHTVTWHFDETKFYCLKISAGCYIWVAVTGKHELYPATVFFAGEGRGNEEFLKIFGNPEDSDFQMAIENAVTDGHSAYPLGLSKLEGYLKKIIRHAICLVHVRRLFLQAIDAMGITNEYRLASRNFSDKDFVEKVQEAVKVSNKNPLNDNSKKVVIATHILDHIINLDCDFGCTTAEEIKERRELYSKGLIDHFFDIINDIRINSPNIIEKRGSGDKKIYEKTVNLPHLKATVYALNHKEGIYKFIEDGNVETHNNIAESAQRNCIRQRANMLFLYSKGGYKAYADAMTIASTLKLSNINITKYMHWAFDCAKLMMENARRSTPATTSKQKCYFPVAQKNAEGEKIGLYDKNYVCEFDNIPWDKLNPWDYLKEFNLKGDIALENWREEKKGGKDSKKVSQGSHAVGKDNCSTSECT